MDEAFSVCGARLFLDRHSGRATPLEQGKDQFSKRDSVALPSSCTGKFGRSNYAAQKVLLQLYFSFDADSAMKYFPWWLRTTSEAPNGEKKRRAVSLMKIFPGFRCAVFNAGHALLGHHPASRSSSMQSLYFMFSYFSLGLERSRRTLRGLSSIQVY
jgi:hypothetical protein